MTKFLITVMILAVVGWVGYGVAYPSGTWRYKMTVEIETPEGIKTGSAVREVTIGAQPAPLPEMKGAYGSVKGEAVVVDLGPRGQVFALLGGHQVFSYAFMGGLLKKEAIRKARSDVKPGLGKVLEPQDYPMFVRFRDLSDPRTVENIYETGWCLEKNANGSCVKEGFHVVADRFAEVFGAGVRLKSVTIETTDERVTWGVEAWLPWLSTIGMGNLGGGAFSGRELYERLSAWDFRKGDTK